MQWRVVGMKAWRGRGRAGGGQQSRLLINLCCRLRSRLLLDDACRGLLRSVGVLVVLACRFATASHGCVKGEQQLVRVKRRRACSTTCGRLYDQNSGARAVLEARGR